MSLAAADRKPEVLFPQQSRAKVEPDFQSIRDAVTARIGILPRRDERVLVKLGDGQEFVIDLAEAVVGDQALPDKPITVSFSTSPRLMAGFLNGTMEPRTALLYGRMPFTGKSECAVRMLDELSGRRYPRQENFTDVPFPAPTTDLELRRAQLREYGYCITKDALSAEQLEALRVRMDEQAAAELAAGRAYEDGGRGANKAARGYRGDDSESDEATAETIAPNQRIWLLHNKGQEFLDLLDNPVIEDLVCHYLEEDFPWVSNFSANIVRASAEPQFLHSDQNSVQPAIPFAIGVNSLFCIDDFTAENGATLDSRQSYPGSRTGAGQHLHDCRDHRRCRTQGVLHYLRHPALARVRAKQTRCARPPRMHPSHVPSLGTAAQQWRACCSTVDPQKAVRQAQGNAGISGDKWSRVHSDRAGRLIRRMGSRQDPCRDACWRRPIALCLSNNLRGYLTRTMHR
jgi:hypothetical protein